MTWICADCNNNNDDSAVECEVCGGTTHAVVEKPVVEKLTLTPAKAKALPMEGGGVVYVPGEYTVIGAHAFEGRIFLRKIVLHSEVTHINKQAFKNCYALASVVGYEKLQHIGEEAFYNCKALVERPTAKSVASNAFATGSSTSTETTTPTTSTAKKATTPSASTYKPSASTYKPTASSTAYKPTTSTYKPTTSTSTYKPTASSSTYRPTTSTYKPTTTSTYKPTTTTSTYKPTSSASSATASSATATSTATKSATRPYGTLSTSDAVLNVCKRKSASARECSWLLSVAPLLVLESATATSKMETLSKALKKYRVKNVLQGILVALFALITLHFFMGFTSANAEMLSLLIFALSSTFLQAILCNKKDPNKINWMIISAFVANFALIANFAMAMAFTEYFNSYATLCTLILFPIAVVLSVQGYRNEMKKLGTFHVFTAIMSAFSVMLAGLYHQDSSFPFELLVMFGGQVTQIVMMALTCNDKCDLDRIGHKVQTAISAIAVAVMAFSAVMGADASIFSATVLAVLAMYSIGWAIVGGCYRVEHVGKFIATAVTTVVGIVGWFAITFFNVAQLVDWTTEQWLYGILVALMIHNVVFPLTSSCIIGKYGTKHEKKASFVHSVLFAISAVNVAFFMMLQQTYFEIFLPLTVVLTANSIYVSVNLRTDLHKFWWLSVVSVIVGAIAQIVALVAQIFASFEIANSILAVIVGIFAFASVGWLWISGKDFGFSSAKMAHVSQLALVVLTYLLHFVWNVSTLITVPLAYATIVCAIVTIALAKTDGKNKKQIASSALSLVAQAIFLLIAM